MNTSIEAKEIPIEDITIGEQMIRHGHDDEYIVELSMSIASMGLLEPIVVRKLPDNKYQLLAGSCRLYAFMRLKRDMIPAVLKEDDGKSIKGVALVENVIRRDMTLTEEVEAVKHLHDTEKMSPAGICDLIGKSRAWVDQRLAIPYLYQEIIDELFDKRISLGHAEVVNQIEEPGLRSLLLNNIIQQKLTIRQTKELATIYIEAPTMEGAINAGLQAEQEIQKAQIPTRSCDLCGLVHELQNIKLVAVCAAGCPPPEENPE